MGRDLRGGVKPIETFRMDRSPELEAKNIARELCSKKMVSLLIKVSDQSVLDRVIKALIREGVSIFAADNKEDIVILYLTRRDKKGCSELVSSL
ncbi:MAG: hypothetical protein DJ555_06395 [Desulfurococcaceae archaeon]|nr:MAG: hypothetical protein DJ555_06395 [Desulfurococcaceae archaeon]